MFTVSVKDHIMIAHSLPREVFGPARNMHGATYVISTEYKSPNLDDDGIVIDIGKAQEILGLVLAPLRFQNLDELPQLEGMVTTTEVLARYIHGQLAERVRPFFQGTLHVTLDESHVAHASYEAEI